MGVVKATCARALQAAVFLKEASENVHHASLEEIDVSIKMKRCFERAILNPQFSIDEFADLFVAFAEGGLDRGHHHSSPCRALCQAKRLLRQKQ